MVEDGEKDIVPVRKAEIEPMDSKVSIEVKNLVVSPQPSLQVALGDVQSLKSMTVDVDGIKAIVWNEEAIYLITGDRNTEIWFKPEITKAAEIFFERKENRHVSMFTQEVTKVWDGDYEPVRFTKRNLLMFLKKYVDALPREVAAAIKSMKLIETKSEDSIMLDEDSDDEKTVKVEHHKTNIPKRFTMTMELMKGYMADLQCEASVVKVKKEYGGEEEKKCIEIRCTNAREVMRDLMTSVCDQLPPNVPRYYGRAKIYREKDR